MLVENKMIKHVVLFFIIMTISCSCNKNESNYYTIENQNDINEYVKEEKQVNSYEKKIKEVNYALKYISNEQMALQEVHDIRSINQSNFDSIVHNYDGLMFFKMEIVIDNFNSELAQYQLKDDAENAYSKRIDYYAFKMQKDFNIIQHERDTIPCVLYHFERNYGISPKNNFMLGFKIKDTKDAVFVYENQFLKTGPIKFVLQDNIILNHTHIKIK